MKILQTIKNTGKLSPNLWFISGINSFESGKYLRPHNTTTWKCQTYNHRCVPDTRGPFYTSKQSYSRQAVSKIHQMHSRWRNTHRWSSSERHCCLSACQLGKPRCLEGTIAKHHRLASNVGNTSLSKDCLELCVCLCICDCLFFWGSKFASADVDVRFSSGMFGFGNDRAPCRVRTGVSSWKISRLGPKA